jgi:hypothetical protein
VGFRADRQSSAELRGRGEDLLHYAITREDAREMQLPTVVEKAQGGKPHKRDIATIRNLAAANFMGPADVRLTNEMHGTVRKSGSSTARSAHRHCARSPAGPRPAGHEYLGQCLSMGVRSLGHASQGGRPTPWRTAGCKVMTAGTFAEAKNPGIGRRGSMISANSDSAVNDLVRTRSRFAPGSSRRMPASRQSLMPFGRR